MSKNKIQTLYNNLLEKMAEIESRASEREEVIIRQQMELDAWNRKLLGLESDKNRIQKELEDFKEFNNHCVRERNNLIDECTKLNNKYNKLEDAFKLQTGDNKALVRALAVASGFIQTEVENLYGAKD